MGCCNAKESLAAVTRAAAAQAPARSPYTADIGANGDVTGFVKAVFSNQDKSNPMQYADGNAWLELLRIHRDAGTRWTDAAFPPNDESLGSVADGATDWVRISDYFHQTAVIQFGFVDEDSALGAAAGLCFSCNPNLSSKKASAPAQRAAARFDENAGAPPPVEQTDAHDAVRAKAQRIVTALRDGRATSADADAAGGGVAALRALCGNEQVATFVECTVAKQLDAFETAHSVRWQSTSSVRVYFDASAALGTPRWEAYVELRFAAPIHMFEREAGDASVVAPGDINQGALSDCYFLCALSILSTDEVSLLFTVTFRANPAHN